MQSKIPLRGALLTCVPVKYMVFSLVGVKTFNEMKSRTGSGPFDLPNARFHQADPPRDSSGPSAGQRRDTRALINNNTHKLPRSILVGNLLSINLVRTFPGSDLHIYGPSSEVRRENNH